MTAMDLDRWRAASPLLDHALDLPPAERGAWLDALDRAQPEVAADVRRLLADREATGFGGFLATPAADLAEPTRLAGRRLGPWVLERELGRGGMGTVWLARRDDGRYEGRVALKFLQSAWLGRAGLARFQQEGSLLARLDHPSIARLLDAGVTGDGDPYLVLEYVDGRPIDAWCDAQRLGVDARLGLFRDVLDAVSAAHARMVVHRDLKPSNVLVGAGGHVKLLDFGVAKLLGADDGLTRDAGQALTPAWAAPEQLRGEPATAATDVYALGLLLHLLLTGRQPWSSATTTGGLAGRLSTLEDAVATPSSTIAGDDAAATRSSTTDALRRRLRGDLDVIVGRALAARPADRYPSASAFADDVRRHLAHEPVAARPPTLAYRARKFARRNRVAVGSASVVLLALLAGIAGTTWQGIEARRERDRALALAARNESIVEFLNTMLTGSARADEALTVRQLFARSRDIVAAGRTGDAAGDAGVALTLARFWGTIGDAKSASDLATLGLARLGDVDDPGLRGALLCTQGYAESLLGRVDEGRELLERGIVASGDDPDARFQCLQNRAYVAQNRNDADGALRDAEAALELLRTSGRATSVAEGAALGNLAYAHYLKGDAQAAEQNFALAAARLREGGRDRTALYVTLLNNRGIAAMSAGDVANAKTNFDAALALAEELSPDTDPPVYLLANRGIANLSLARWDEAIASFERVERIALRTGAAAFLASANATMAYALRAKGETARSAERLSRARAMIGRDVPADSVPAVTVMAQTGGIALLDRRWADARDAYGEMIAFFDARDMRIGPVVQALRGRAEASMALGELDSAQADLDRALPMARQLQGGKPASGLTGLTLTRVAELQRLRGDPVAARRSAAEAVAQLTAALGADHPETRRARDAAAL